RIFSVFCWALARPGTRSPVVRPADRAPAPVRKSRRDTGHRSCWAMLAFPVRTPMVGGNTTLLGDGIKTRRWKAVNLRPREETGHGEVSRRGGLGKPKLLPNPHPVAAVTHTS